jgi:hypothetical protein
MKSIGIALCLGIIVVMTACTGNPLAGAKCAVSDEPYEEVLDGYKTYLNENDSLQRKIRLVFLNNPYLIDNSFRLTMIFCGGIVYKGTFDEFIDLSVPKRKGPVCQMKIILQKNGRSYIFNTMQLSAMDPGDDIVHVVFASPEDDWFTFYFFFSKSGKVTLE